MEQILNLIEVDSANSNIKVSITESTMMQILHKSMDKAYRKVKSKTGVIERLNEISKFYQLAVIQLEGCLKFVQQERGNYDLETSQELLLDDLTEIKDRLQGRLKEVESAISDKDKELSERLGNELKLKKALERSEKKRDSLYADLEEHRKNEGIDELFLGSQASIEAGDREGEFCELKHSVDQQVWNIQQQLEPNYQIQDEERNQGIDNKKIEQMGSDIGILKGTLDLAFCKMQNAIFLSELGPIEHQWMWNIERSISAVVIKDLLKGFRENFEDEVKKQELQASLGLRKHLSKVIREINVLIHELLFVTNPDEAQVKKPKEILKARLFSEGQDLGKLGIIKQHGEEDSGNDHGSHVVKMIKNHESIIRGKSEELDLLTRELLGEKSSPPTWKEKDSVNPKQRIQELMVRLESLINSSPEIDDVFFDNKYDCELQKPLKTRPFTDDRTDIKKCGAHSMEEIWEQVNKSSVPETRNEAPCSEIKLVKQEMEDSNLQTRLMEDIQLTLFKSLVDEFHAEMLNHHMHFLIKEGMYENFIQEMKTEWNKEMGSAKYDTLFPKATAPESHQANSGLDHSEGTVPLLYSENTNLEELIHPDYFFRELWHDIYTFLLREILREWNEYIETFESVSCLSEEICLLVFGEIFRDIINTSNSSLNKLREIKANDNVFKTVAMSIKDDVLKVFLADIIKELHMKIYAFSLESLIREDVFQLVIVEAVKQGCIVKETDDRRNRDQSPNNSISVDNLRHTLDKLVKFFEDEESLILTACSETKQQKIRLQHVMSRFNFDQHEHCPGFLTYDGNSTNSADIKLEKALLQLDYGKASLNELGSQLGITINNLDPIITTRNCRNPSIDEYLETFFQDIAQMLKSFEFESCMELGRYSLRLEEMEGEVNLVAKLIASLIQKESLYRKAFIRRCENLQMAEAEVDLLGDQVEQLTELLKKIYAKLHQHSPLLHHYFEVSEMLKLIEKEIGER
ncbi:hypothetical protein ERO13_A06G167500v2 [Gossypium hirsutum]|uniref:Uncharacterized protein isoform X1 n=1 Tax=Gossypium hirsutum TaxID=3635 RepID=A0ABM3BY89_GOSHI|nr:uncharacterized protein LOC107941437 isoform X1 [Gossypium hirsutum]KAG4196402.1 hypothetical protein ERO13_A06G167500v2 [Gossypium hirsutum]